jgi:hypothetical protein
MDQTPLPFEFNDGRTYARKGGKTVWVKAQRSGWEKRQATLELTLHADGLPHTKPRLMFKGDDGIAAANKAPRRAEQARYPRGIRVMSVQTGAIALVSLLMLFLFLENGRKASSYLLASERTKHLR